MMYMASSVASLLAQASKACVEAVYDLDVLKCPKSNRCNQSACSLGKNLLCKKQVDVVYYYNGITASVSLFFYYQLKSHPGEGFINCNDRSLKKLISMGIIDKDALVCA